MTDNAYNIVMVVKAQSQWPSAVALELVNQKKITGHVDSLIIIFRLEGKGLKKRSKSMVFDHRGGKGEGGHPKPKPYSD